MFSLLFTILIIIAAGLNLDEADAAGFNAVSPAGGVRAAASTVTPPSYYDIDPVGESRMVLASLALSNTPPFVQRAALRAGTRRAVAAAGFEFRVHPWNVWLAYPTTAAGRSCASFDTTRLTRGLMKGVSLRRFRFILSKLRLKLNSGFKFAFQIQLSTCGAATSRWRTYRRCFHRRGGPYKRGHFPRMHASLF